jgi:hypothetical protein
MDNHRRPAEAHQHVRQSLQARRSRRDLCRLFERRQEVVVGEKEPVDGTVEHDDLHLLIFLDRRDDLAQCQRLLWAKDVHRRKVESDPPV